MVKAFWKTLSIVHGHELALARLVNARDHSVKIVILY